MRIICSIQGTKRVCRTAQKKGMSIGFVPTMGALHEGHMSLIRASVKENDFTVLSIFVNPIQFGKGEDFNKYPRTLEKDAKAAKKNGVDIIFCPDMRSMYPDGYRTYVEVGSLQDNLCGVSRPGHFKGVVTVVAKLFEIVRPDRAYFGRKDAQQAAIIKKMAEDLNMDVRIRTMPTVREKNGLALSSRNTYLSYEEKKEALVLYRSLKEAKRLYHTGETNARRIISGMKKIIGSAASAKIDYVKIADPRTMKDVRNLKGGELAAVCVYIGKTRLIDNIILEK